jgi:integrase
LKTRSKREAIALARKMWVSMINNLEKQSQNKIPFSEPKNWYEDFDAERKLQEAMLRHGKLIYKEMENAQKESQEQIDSTIIESFFENLGSDDYKCLQCYNDYINTTRATKPDTDCKNLEKQDIKPEDQINNKLVTELVEEFLNEKMVIANVVKKTLTSYRDALNVFLDILDNPTIAKVNRVNVQLYKNSLMKLPKNMNKLPQLRNKTILEKINSGFETIAPTTIKNTARKVKEFLKWGFEQKYFEEDFGQILSGIVKKSKKDNENTASFDDHDLNKIFGYTEYQLNLFKGYPFRYWIPLIGLYTGCRLNEICQLYVKDICNDDGIHYFNITKENHRLINGKIDKKLKSFASERKIPIHKKLIDLGIFDYIEEVRKHNEERLFPHLNYSKSDEKYIRKVSDFFNSTYKGKGLLNIVGIEKKTSNGSKNFHSFRKTMRNHLYQIGIDPNKIDDIIGHEKQGTGNKVYSNPLNLKEKKKIIDSVIFNFDHPKKWNKKYYA